MAKENGRDYMYLIWKEPVSRRQYIIAKLSKNGKYEFEYDFEIDTAIKKGFQPLIAFADVTKRYESNRLFATFSGRIPDKRRKNINEILYKYDMEYYDEYELLKRSGGKLPIDNLEFIDPILMNGENPIEREFFIAGPRHYVGCEGKECGKSLQVLIGDELNLELDPNNIHDSNAIRVKFKDKLLGYIPRYYNKELIELLGLNWRYKIVVSQVNKKENCNECLKVKLQLYK